MSCLNWLTLNWNKMDWVELSWDEMDNLKLKLRLNTLEFLDPILGVIIRPPLGGRDIPVPSS